MISVIVPAIAVFCIDIPELTIWSFQIWRLFVSMYGQFPSIMSILSVLFSFMWMHRMIKVCLSLFRTNKDPLYTRLLKLYLSIYKYISYSIWYRSSLRSCLKPKNHSCFLGMGGFPSLLSTSSEHLLLNLRPNADSAVCLSWLKVNISHGLYSYYFHYSLLNSSALLPVE